MFRKFCFKTSSSIFLWLLSGLVLANTVTTDRLQVNIETLVEGLEHPWGLAFFDDGRLLVSERTGQLRIIDAGKVSEPLEGLPEIWVGGQGGLMDVAIHEGLIYFSYAEPGKLLTNSTAVARATLVDNRLENVEVIFSQAPKYISRAHFGSRLVFAPDGTLFITLGERFLPRDDAQTLDNHHGKLIRINPDGTVPENNPFVNVPDALPEIWSFGHRNSQGAAINPETGKLWMHEHGPKGGDEINIPEAGKNYGWPVITFGREYTGGEVGDGITHKEGMEQPIYYWVPSIAPSGMMFYSGDAFPAWQGNLFVGSLKFKQLVRLELDGDEVVAEERLFEEAIGQRIRDVRQGPDGLIYLLTDDSKNGKILRLSPVAK